MRLILGRGSGLFRGLVVCAVAVAFTAAAAASPPSASITVPAPLLAGQAFSASFSGVKPNVYPWGHLTCDGGLEEWRANQGDSTIGVFELLGVQAGETCSLDLVDTQHDDVLATVSVTVQ